eukprot:6194115-Pleurochrysis_carterae.AAC.1
MQKDEPGFRGASVRCSCLPWMRRVFALSRRADQSVCPRRSRLLRPRILTTFASTVDSALGVSARRYPDENAWAKFLASHGGEVSFTERRDSDSNDADWHDLIKSLGDVPADF